MFRPSIQPTEKSGAQLNRLEPMRRSASVPSTNTVAAPASRM